MSSRTIVSLAILKANWDLQKKGYLDNFVPILAECARILPDEIITVPALQRELKKRFGLDFPQNAISVILKRARKRGYVKVENNIYRRNQEKLDKLNFSQMQRQVIQMHEKLISGLIQFCKRKYGIVWNSEQAEAALQFYLQENEVCIISAVTHGTIIPPTKPPAKNTKYFVGAFIQQLQETQSSMLEYLETVVKGNMLANAIFLTDPNQAFRKFRKTEVYFDTSFLIFALEIQPKSEE